MRTQTRDGGLLRREVEAWRDFHHGLLAGEEGQALRLDQQGAGQRNNFAIDDSAHIEFDAAKVVESKDSELSSEA